MEPEIGQISVLGSDTTEQQLKTVFHELNHYNFPGMTEEAIEQNAVELYNSLSPRQLGFFEFLLFNPASA